MRIVSVVVQELWHLFVEDRSFAAAIVAWPCLIGLGCRQVEIVRDIAPEALAVGMIAILVVGVVRHRPAGGPK
ncbi:MAG TPA: hypothetical protein VFG62_04680 [Rhodopila sp.]|jgi:hypothetical protein|nr:hypothetical protein [Rhodopila sp.]